MKNLFASVLIGLAFNSFSQLNVNLQGCYPMDCDSAVNQAPPGSVHDGAISNVTCTTNRFGWTNTAYEFAGNTGSFIRLPGTTGLKPQAITVTGWYYVDQTTVNNGAYIVFTKSSCSTNQEAYAMCVSSGSFLVAKSGNTTPTCQRDILWGPKATAGWHFVAFYIDNNKLELYVDGCAGSSMWSMGTTIAWDYDAAKDVILGGSQEVVDAPFTGKMDNLRFYDRQLNAAEMCSVYKNDPRCQYDGSRQATSTGEINIAKDIMGLSQNVPNPFRDNTTITYRTPSTFKTAQIKVLSIEGKVVKTIDVTTAGDGTIQVNTAGLTTGFYTYSLVIDGQTVDTKKMLKE